jgi:hypothetical protein
VGAAVVLVLCLLRRTLHSSSWACLKEFEVGYYNVSVHHSLCVCHILQQRLLGARGSAGCCPAPPWLLPISLTERTCPSFQRSSLRAHLSGLYSPFEPICPACILRSGFERPDASPLRASRATPSARGTCSPTWCGTSWRRPPKRAASLRYAETDGRMDRQTHGTAQTVGARGVPQARRNRWADG